MGDWRCECTFFLIQNARMNEYASVLRLLYIVLLLIPQPRRDWQVRGPNSWTAWSWTTPKQYSKANILQIQSSTSRRMRRLTEDISDCPVHTCSMAACRPRPLNSNLALPLALRGMRHLCEDLGTRGHVDWSLQRDKGTVLMRATANKEFHTNWTRADTSL